MTTRDDCAARDASDVLAPLRNEFILTDREIYLDGNSLGPVSRAVGARVNEVINDEWGRGLVRGWNDSGWMAMPTRLGDRLAPLIGARPGEVLVADTLTFLLAKLIGGALDQRKDRSVVLTDVANFHSDLYIVEAMARRAGRRVTVKPIERGTLEGELNDDVGVGAVGRGQLEEVATALVRLGHGAARERRREDADRNHAAGRGVDHFPDAGGSAGRDARQNDRAAGQVAKERMASDVGVGALRDLDGGGDRHPPKTSSLGL